MSAHFGPRLLFQLADKPVLATMWLLMTLGALEREQPLVGWQWAGSGPSSTPAPTLLSAAAG